MRKRQKVNKNPLIDKVMLGLNIFAVLLLLLSYLAPYTDPRDYLFIADLGFGYPILLAGVLVFIIYWIVRKKIVFTIISLLSILAGINILTYYFGFSFSGGDTHDKSALKIMQYNVRAFVGVGKYDNLPTQGNILDIIKREAPDVLNIQEFGEKIPVEYNAADSLLKHTDLKYYNFKSFQTSRTDRYGDAIFSKYPIVKFDTIAASKILNMRTAYADIKINNKIIRVYCVHLAAVEIKSQAKNVLLKGNVSTDESSFIITKVNNAFLRRSFQVDKIKRHMQDCPYPYIVTGDFNDTPISFAVNEIGDGLKNAFREKGKGFVNTYYSYFPLHIDNIFVSPQFDVLSYKALDEEVSDHKPIVAYVKLEGGK
jgi:endonuclease/exonuclease/phosphatase family metal-dependent hydrolase